MGPNKKTKKQTVACMVASQEKIITQSEVITKKLAPSHDFLSSLNLYKALQLSHPGAPCSLQAGPVNGLPLGHSHTAKPRGHSLTHPPQAPSFEVYVPVLPGGASTPHQPLPP